MTEQEIVRESLLEIFKKNGYAASQRLTQRDFDHISQEIENRTGILISGTTIKRLLHGDFRRLPQIATLDAISKYLGYPSWQEYRPAKGHPEDWVPTQEKKVSSDTGAPKNAPAPSKRVKLMAVSLAVGVIVLVGFIQFSQTKREPNFDKASFSVHKTTHNDIPNTVVFNYDVDEVRADSFFIQQSWDRNRRVRIFKNNHTLTDIYYEPGYHIAKLIANDSVIKAVGVSIPTDRWFLFAKDIHPGSNPEYFTASHLITDGLLGVTEKDLRANGIDATREKEYAYTFFPSKIAVSSDNYVLNTRIRMKEVKKNYCPYIKLEVFCQRYSMFFKSTSSGCSSESMLQFGEQFISGKESDLASLGCDVTQWMAVELSVKDRQVSLRFNQKEVFATSYQQACKRITGLGFMSNGLCEIDFVELKGSDGTVVYAHNFDRQNH